MENLGFDPISTQDDFATIVYLGFPEYLVLRDHLKTEFFFIAAVTGAAVDGK